MLESTTEDSFSIDVKPPTACTRMEIAGFAAMALAVEQVEREELEARVEQAFALLFVRKHGRLLGVGGLQRPSLHRRERLFGMACAIEAAADFPLEFGWAFLSPSVRGRGIASRLTQEAVYYAARHAMPLCASCRADDQKMQSALRSAGFEKRGDAWMSNDIPFMLFVRAFGRVPSAQPVSPGAEGYTF